MILTKKLVNIFSPASPLLFPSLPSYASLLEIVWKAFLKNSKQTITQESVKLHKLNKLLDFWFVQGAIVQLKVKK